MAVLGRALIFLALAVALYGIVAAIVGARRGRADLIESARRSVYALFVLTAGAYAILEAAFLRSDFSSGLKAGLTRDFWAAFQPDQESIGKIVDALDKRLADAPAEQQMRAAFGLTELLRSQPPPATFRLIASPLVSWIWLGAIIVFIGGLLAVWPAPDTARRRATARAAARVAHDLGRA